MPGRVLMVAYNFPPLGGVGILRTLKYATYLPDNGWQPIVLTARDPSGYLDHDALRSLSPDLRVERALAPDPVKLRRLLGRSARTLLVTAGRRRGALAHGIGAGGPSAGLGTPAATPGGAAATPGGAAAAPAPPDWQKQAGALWSAAVRATFYPDDQIGWVPFAIARGLELCRTEAIDAVYSSSPPVSSHLAAAVIARRAGLPWIADFRDPWVGNAFAREPNRIHELLQRRIELRIVEKASRVVFASEGFTEAYRARYPWAADRLVTIPNGYDRADLAGGDAEGTPGDGSESDGRFHLVYGGSVYGQHELEIFLDGLELLIGRRPEIRDRLRVEFIGWLNMHNQAVAARYSTPARLGSIVSFRGQVSHREAVARLARADALLQVTADEPNKGQIQSGKLLEYIGLDRPILAVVPPGHARALLAELDWGIVADPSPAGVAEGLERLLAAPAPDRRADVEGRYDRVNLAKRFAAVLDEVVAP
jgi:glycosyltransferase involved in cell wall biosynthesis